MLSLVRRIVGWYRKRQAYEFHTKSVRNLMSTCQEIMKLNTAQKKEVQEYYKKHYGKEIPDYLWHEYYYSRNGIFSPKYVPNYILQEINAALYDPNIAAAFDDKNLYYTFFPDFRQPRGYVKCINGFFYDETSSISRKEAESIVAELGHVIIKPTFRSCNGNGVKHLNLVGGKDERSGMGVGELFDSYGKNFVIQEMVCQHKDLAALCPSSVNTIRIVTYRRNEEETVVIYAVMRIGKFGSEVDNTSAGGMVCKIDEEGKLSKYAIASKPAGKFEKNEAGLVFEGYQVPCYKDVVTRAKEMHKLQPHFIMIGWDFSVNEQNEVVFIEMNAPFGLHQPAAGPGYGKYTDEIFEKCFGKRQ